MARSSLTGSGSYMPVDMYLKKNEMTCIDYDPGEISNYMMQTISDFREPPSIFDADEHRYDNHSREKLHLRHTGDRSGGVMPWLPDGTFLDYTFLSDAGNQYLPNFQDLRSQIDLRVRDIPVYTDEDYSVPSKEVSASEMISRKDEIHKRARREMMIFDTSKDYIQLPGTIGKPLLGSAMLKKSIHDQTPEFLSQEASSNRNWQIDMSNSTPIGWQTTPDSVFKVSRYDTPRKMGDLSADAYSNKLGGVLDTDFLVSFEGKNVPRSVAVTMIEIMRQRKRVEEFMKTSGTQYDSSKEQAVRKIKQLDESLKELMRRYSDHSSDMYSLKVEQNNINGKRYLQRDDPNKINKSLVALQLCDMIKKATNNRKMGKQVSDDLRGEIIQTSSSSAIFNTDQNRKTNNNEFTNKTLWESLALHKKKEQMMSFNYATVQKSKNLNRDMFIVDEYKRLQHPDLNNKRIITENKLYIPDAIEYEQLKELNVPIYNKRNASSVKNSIELTDMEHSLDDMRDLNSRLYTAPGRIRSVS